MPRCLANDRLKIPMLENPHVYEFEQMRLPDAECVVLVMVIVSLVYIAGIMRTFSEDGRSDSAVTAVFMDWRRCTLTQLDKIKNRADKATAPSVVISLGIGAEVVAEEKLKKVLPSGTEFFGADPVIVLNAKPF
ncbi:hypothetical protein KIN20_009756 [Parelaphostrongylus tenuis]|uniref:Uncharacterized protein n=1 Tax=Parelaphostrongylus tenuis TaxID=148309 RepID=A0AAD5MPH1_PARTN|nr:hypothetical protein KIN20_009756 [Parelaphostrongylus tenuis]